MEPLLHQMFQQSCSYTEDDPPIHPPKVAEVVGSSKKKWRKKIKKDMVISSINASVPPK